MIFPCYNSAHFPTLWLLYKRDKNISYLLHITDFNAKKHFYACKLASTWPENSFFLECLHTSEKNEGFRLQGNFHSFLRVSSIDLLVTITSVENLNTSLPGTAAIFFLNYHSEVLFGKKNQQMPS